MTTPRKAHFSQAQSSMMHLKITWSAARGRLCRLFMWGTVSFAWDSTRLLTLTLLCVRGLATVALDWGSAPSFEPCTPLAIGKGAEALVAWSTVNGTFQFWRSSKNPILIGFNLIFPILLERRIRRSGCCNIFTPSEKTSHTNETGRSRLDRDPFVK